MLCRSLAQCLLLCSAIPPRVPRKSTITQDNFLKWTQFWKFNILDTFWYWFLMYVMHEKISCHALGCLAYSSLRPRSVKVSLFSRTGFILYIILLALNGKFHSWLYQRESCRNRLIVYKFQWLRDVMDKQDLMWVRDQRNKWDNEYITLENVIDLSLWKTILLVYWLSTIVCVKSNL